MSGAHGSFSARRKFLALGAGAGALTLARDPVAIAIGSIVDGIIARARAVDAGAASPRNYLFLYLSGGMPRWYFDLVLKTGKSDPKFVSSPAIATRFDGSTPVYDTITSPAGPFGSYELPTLWGCDLPTPTPGKTVPMMNLAANMLSIRGIDMLSDGHNTNAIKNLQPIPGSLSLDGLVADASRRPLPAVGDGSLAQGYRSATGLGQAVLDWGSPFASLLSPFNASGDTLPSGYLTRRQALDTAVKRGLAALASYAQSNQPGATVLYNMRDNAESMLRKGLGDLAGDFGALQSKYEALVASCGAQPRPVVTDHAISPANLPAGFTDPTTGSHNMTWLRMWNADSTRSMLAAENPDLRSLLTARTSIQNLASLCAVAEYMFIRGYSSAAALGMGYPTALNLQSNQPVGGSTAAWNPAYQVYDGDEHFTGTAVGVLINSFVYQSLAACLNELMSSYRAAGIWENTVIHVGSEFSRMPYLSGWGSYHAIDANLTTLFSGAIQGPLVLGNTRPNTDPSFLGSYGSAAPVNGFDGDGIHLLMGHAASTIAGLLGVPSPAPNNLPVATLDASTGKIQPRIGMENA